MKIMDIKDDVPLMGDVCYCSGCRGMDFTCNGCDRSFAYVENEDEKKVYCGNDNGNPIHICNNCVSNNGLEGYKRAYKVVDTELVRM